MTSQNQDFAFCTLALGKKYRNLTKQLASDLKQHSPGTYVVIYTDDPDDFKGETNILAYKYRQQGILLCYHDRRLVIGKTLSQFKVAIHIDADTRILSNMPKVNWYPGIVGRQENLLEHVSKYSTERLPVIEKVATKLNIPLEKAQYVGESLYFVGSDEGKEKEFIEYWGMIGRYFELNGIHGGDGNAIGLAAAKVGWTVRSDNWQQYNQITKHLDASIEAPDAPKESQLSKLNRRLSYHYRLNVARMTALKNYSFFYG